MSKIFLPLCTLFFISCTEQPNKNAAQHSAVNIGGDNYKWTELTAEAPYPKAWNFQLFSIRDTLWAMHHVGTWFSVNGKDWTKSPLENVLKDNGFLDYVWFRNKLFALGTFEGNIDKHTWTSTIRTTTDMKTWNTEAAESNLPRRFFIHPVVYHDKIWLIGGSDETGKHADIWNTADGVHWTKVGNNMSFGKRDDDVMVTFNNRLYLLGNDAWSSADGISWQLETSHIATAPIYRYAAIVFDNKIWLLGCNRDGAFSNEVLVSTDGKTWSSSKAPWSPRGSATACLFKGKVFMTGGKYGGTPNHPDFVYSNDVWVLEKE